MQPRRLFHGLSLWCLLAAATAVAGGADDPAPPPPWAPMWLSSTPVSAAFRAKLPWTHLSCGAAAAPPPPGPLQRACQELARGLSGLLARNVSVAAVAGAGAAADASVVSVVVTGPAAPSTPVWPPSPALESYALAVAADGSVQLTSPSAHGALYGAWRLLSLVRREAAPLLVPGVAEAATPGAPLRMWQLWDNLDGSVERGYAGSSIFYPLRAGADLRRATDYARLLSSVGVNAISWDNVNACGAGNEQLLAAANLALLAPIAAIFYDYGIHSLLVPCWTTPQTVGGLNSSDITQSWVATWWAAKAREVAAALPGGAFRGLMFKGDTEGQPGPNDDNITELAGANFFGGLLAPIGAICIWRAFSHPPGGRDMPVDQALYQFERFAPFENATLPNVVLQIKNGPFDFQAREPVHALFGRLPHVSVVLELEVATEYLGQEVHLAALPFQWESYLGFDLGTQPGASARGGDGGDGGGGGGGEICASAADTTLAGVVGGGPLCNPYSGVAGVSNLGSFANWTGHVLGGSLNTFGFGRLAFKPSAAAADIAAEWAAATLAGSDASALAEVTDMLAASWPAYENVTSSLGWGFVCAGNHYDMDPASRVDYTNASRTHVGYDRAGGGYADCYNGAVAAAFKDLDACPEELLLAFHNVPYTHTLRGAAFGGLSVAGWIAASHAAGAASSRGFADRWRALAGGGLNLSAFVTAETPSEEAVFEAVAARLSQGATSAATFASVVAEYFAGLNATTSH